MRPAIRWVALALAGTLAAASSSLASPHAGTVTFNGLPVPGASITLSRSGRQARAVTDDQGRYHFDDLPDGSWEVEVVLFGFAPLREMVMVGADIQASTWSLSLQAFDELRPNLQSPAAPSAPLTAAEVKPASGRPVRGAAATAAAATPARPAAPVPVEGDTAPAPAVADGLLINGSVNNGAASPFAQLPAFGNNRRGQRSLYNGGLGIVFGNSALDARPYSFTDRDTPKPSYNDLRVLGSFSGPVRIPGVKRSRPTLFVGYQRLLDTNANTESALVPTLAQRSGVVGDGSVISPERISPQAAALLSYYPLPNASGTGFNYQAPALTATSQDSLQVRMSGSLTSRDLVSGSVSYQRTNGDLTNLFGFTDHSYESGIDATVNYSHRWSQFTSWRARYQLTTRRTEVTPFFANRINVSGDAGIDGNDQASENWGPPSLSFASGIAALSTAQFSARHPRTDQWTGELLRALGRHSWTFGAGMGRHSFNAYGQQDGRGSFAFTGLATGDDFADFLLGIPSTVSIANGNRDKLFLGTTVNAYASDDWRVSPSLTVNAGLRWEFESPLTEKGGQLSNLDVTDAFDAYSVVTPDHPQGAVSGREYPAALVASDVGGLQPRVGVAWKPVAGSSLVVRAAYGAYRSSGVYDTLGLLLAQQPPFSNTFSVTNSLATALTLANAFTSTIPAGPNTFAVDPDFRVGVAHNWLTSVQRDLPASLTVIGTYLGTRGQHLMQEFLPNTFPAGGVNPCPTCPAGFVYLTSGGHSLRNAAQLQLRRRLRNGLTASAQYTLAKATDNASLFVPSGDAATTTGVAGATIAQDWTNLNAEESRSTFDRRHQFTAQVQYTSGMGVTGGALIDGLRGKLLKGWTLTSQLTVGSGLPVTPTYVTPVNGTGVTGTVRGSLTGASTDVPAGYYANPAAYGAPAPGEWGNAERHSIGGPSQFLLDAGVGRSFAWTERLTFDWRLDATNLLNRVTYSDIDAIVGSERFGLPNRANTMRKIQMTARMRF